MLRFATTPPSKDEGWFVLEIGYYCVYYVVAAPAVVAFISDMG